MSNGDDQTAKVVLVADDDPAVRNLISAALGSRGFLITQATDGRSALDYFHESPQRFDLILMDYRMPELDGISAAQAMHKRWPQARVALMSTDDVAEQLPSLNLAGFLAKPFHAYELIQFVEHQLLRSQL